jgi:hypothetical protein
MRPQGQAQCCFESNCSSGRLRPALGALAIRTQAKALWRWPFAADVDYLTCATLAGAP